MKLKRKFLKREFDLRLLCKNSESATKLLEHEENTMLPKACVRHTSLKSNSSSRTVRENTITFDSQDTIGIDFVSHYIEIVWRTRGDSITSVANLESKKMDSNLRTITIGQKTQMNNIGDRIRYENIEIQRDRSNVPSLIRKVAIYTRLVTIGKGIPNVGNGRPTTGVATLRKRRVWKNRLKFLFWTIRVWTGQKIGTGLDQKMD